MTGLDLAAYLARIFWRGGTPAPDHATLAALYAGHRAHIPFENLDVLLGRPIRLDLDSLLAKLVHSRRGGYCFEHVTLFAAVLAAVGFRPVLHDARVVVFAPRTAAPRTHVFLTVPLDGTRYVVDPGFAAYAPDAPLPLRDTAAVPAGDHPAGHHLRREDAGWVLVVPHEGDLKPGWISTLEPVHPIDCELANHFTATHPASIFRANLMASAVTPDGRVNVLNDTVTRVGPSSTTRTRLPDRAALRRLFATDFGIDLPELDDLRVPAVPAWGWKPMLSPGC